MSFLKSSIAGTWRLEKNGRHSTGTATELHETQLPMEQIIKDKAPKPPGLVPKNLQAFILVGLALLMVFIMAVTGRRQPVPPNTTATPLLPGLVPVNSQKVSDFQKNIEQTQRESAAQVKAALVTAAEAIGILGKPDRPALCAHTLRQAHRLEGADGQTPSDPIRDEQRKRAYVSLFSDNVALTYRKESRGDRHSANASVATNGLVPRVPTVSDPFPTQDPLVAQAGAELAREGQLFAQAQQAGLMPQLPLSSATANFAQDHSACKRFRP